MPGRSSFASRIRWTDRAFWLLICVLAGSYLLLIVGMVAADAWWALSQSHFSAIDAKRREELWSSVTLTLTTCTAAALLSLLVAVPAGYMLSRATFRGKFLIDALLDIPVVLPPLVIGLSLLLMMRIPIPGTTIRLHDLLPFDVIYAAPGVILAMFAVGAALAVRTMRTTFDHVPKRSEDVAQVLGCSRAQAFALVTLPATQRGMITAFTLAWARAMGEFGPIIVIAGTMPKKTEVMATSVFFELSVGNLDAALAISLVMIAIALVVMITVRLLGDGTGNIHDRS